MLIETAQLYSAKWPPYVCTSIVLAGGAVLTAIIGLARKGSKAVRLLPGAGFVVFGASMFWPTPAGWRYAALAAAMLSLCLHFALNHDAATDSKSLDDDSCRAAYVYLGVSLLLAGAFLLYDLGGYAGTLLAWEASTVQGFANRFLTGQSPAQTAKDAFLWQSGLLSQGDGSLFYGAATYALFHLIGFSAWTLRIASVICALLSLIVIFVIGRRFFGNTVAGAVSATLAFSTSFLFYGRYASSPAGTLFAILVALYCVLVFLDDDRSAWWMGGVAAAALYLATLQYASGRIVVLILIPFVALASLLQGRNLRWRRLSGLALLVLGLYAVWSFQDTHGRQDYLLAVRGEQFFRLSQQPQAYADRLGMPVDGGQPSLYLKLLLLLDVVRTNIPQYLRLMLPWALPNLRTSEPLVDSAGQSLTPYYAPFAVFAALGLGHSLRRIRRWPHACLLVYFLGGSVALLMTSHVDGHRADILAVPITFWIGFGIWETIQILRRAGVPQVIQHALAGALALTLSYNLLNGLYYRRTPEPTRERAVLQVISHISRPVLLGYDDWPGRDVVWVQLGMLERARVELGWKGTLLPPDLLEPSRDRAPELSDATLNRLDGVIQDAVLLLTPPSAFRRVAEKLKQRGARIKEIGPPEFPLLSIEGADAGGS